MTDVIGLIIKARDQASAELSKVGKALGGLEGDIKKAEKALVAAGAAGAGLLVALGAAASGARDEARTKRQLAKALDSVGESYSSLGGEIEAVIAQQQYKTATSDEDQRHALVQLLGLTGDLDDAMQALALSIDAAAVTQTGLGEITRQVGNFLRGNISVLETLGLRVDASATAHERLAALERAVGGQAEEAADDISRLRVVLADTSDVIGSVVLPVVNGLANGIGATLQAFNELDPAIQSAVVALGAGAGFTGVLAGVIAALPKLREGIDSLGSAIDLMSTVTSKSSKAIRSGLASAFSALSSSVSSMTDLLTPAASGVSALNVVLGTLKNAALAAAAAIQTSLAAAIRAVVAILGTIAFKITAVVALLGGLVSALSWFLSDEEQEVERNIEAVAVNFDKIREASGRAVVQVRELPVVLRDLQAEVDKFLGRSKDIETLFREKFGEIPAAAAEQLKQLGIVVEAQTGAMEKEFKDSLNLLLSSLDEILGEEAVESINEAGDKLYAAWKEGPQKAVEEGVDAVAVELDKLPEVVGLASLETGGILVDQWAPVTELISNPVFFEVDRAIAKLQELPEIAAAAVAQAQQSLSAFDGGQIGSAISTGGQFGDLNDAASVQAAIASTKQQIAALQQVLQGGGGAFNTGLVAEANLEAAQSQLQQLLALLGTFNNPQQFAAGTGFFTGGFASVGEQGPEKVFLPRGSQVQSAGQGGGGFTNYGTLNIESGSSMDAQLADILAGAI